MTDKCPKCGAERLSPLSFDCGSTIWGDRGFGQSMQCRDNVTRLRERGEQLAVVVQMYLKIFDDPNEDYDTEIAALDKLRAALAAWEAEKGAADA